MTRCELLMALARGEVVEHVEWNCKGRKWEWCSVWSWSVLDPQNNFLQNSWRIKPKVKMVPLGPDDINLHHDLFRSGGSEKQVATGMTNNSIWIGNALESTWLELQRMVERSIDGGHTWGKCEKPFCPPEVAS